MGYFVTYTKRGENTAEANKSAQGKAKGAKVQRIAEKVEAQICGISNRIERAEAQRNARRAKRK